MKTFKKLFAFGSILGLYTFIMHITTIGCPIKWATGVSCPGCGLSRSVICALQFDFAGMIESHALMPLIIFMLLFAVLFEDKFSRKTSNIIIFSGAFLVLSYYLYRMIYLDTTILQFSIQDGAIYKFFSFLFTILSN